jgi:membrane protein required for colicin V production
MLDLILVLAFLYFLLLGVYRGFINLIFKFLGFAGGVFVGSLFYKSFSSLLSKIFNSNPYIVNFLSFLIILMIITGFFILFEKFIKRFMYKKRYIKLGDRVLGGFLGLLIFFGTLFLLKELKEKNQIANSLISKSQIISLISKDKNQN